MSNDFRPPWHEYDEWAEVGEKWWERIKKLVRHKGRVGYIVKARHPTRFDSFWRLLLESQEEEE